jgi:hypothetical protein
MCHTSKLEIRQLLLENIDEAAAAIRNKMEMYHNI